MSANLEKEKGAPAATVAPVPTECRKKKSEVNEGYIKDIVNHIDEFVHASYDEHKSCLQKTIGKLFGTSKGAPSATTPSAAQQPAAQSTSAPVVSALPLRVRTG